MIKKKVTTNKDVSEAITNCIKKISGPRDSKFFTEMLTGLVKNNSFPIELLDSVLVPPASIGKTRFDQIYDAVMSLVFPEYRENTIARLLGPAPESGIKIWRAMFPERFGITHVLIRATSYQEAFAFACDYACRLSLHVYNKIPTDLSIRVMFMSEGALRRHLSLREVNRRKKRRDLKLEAREYTSKQLNGARIAAAGSPRDPKYSIFRYMEKKDLRRITEAGGPSRISSIESETYKPSLRKRRPKTL